MSKNKALDGIDILQDVAGKISLGNYSDAQNLFTLTDKGRCHPAIAGLAEAFGMMLVQVEARDLHLKQLIDRLNDTNKQLEAALATLDEKNKFMTVLVHELKSPIAISKMMVDVLNVITPDREKIGEVAGKIGTRLDQLLALITEILEISRARETGQAEQQEMADLTAQVKETYEDHKDHALAKGLSITLTAPETPMVARLNPRLFKIVVSNLLSNAIKYTLEGSVHVAVSRDGAWAEITVADTGIGIPEQDKQQLFNMYFRAANARRSKIKGTGIGLSNIREFVSRFGGTVEVASQENKGSSFTLRIPLQAGPESQGS